MHSPAGQVAIRLRELLLSADTTAAAALVALLDTDHRLEVLLGAALRDARDDHRAAALYLAADATGALDTATWTPLCARLSHPGDASLDALAAAWVASGALPEHWHTRGRAPTAAEATTLRRAPAPDDALVALVAAGVAGPAILATYADLPLHGAVAAYYSGRILALGWRPLVVLALSGADARPPTG